MANSAVRSLANLKHLRCRTSMLLTIRSRYYTLYSRAKQLDAIDLPNISVYLSHLVIVLVCDLGARFDRTVRWLSAYPKF